MNLLIAVALVTVAFFLILSLSCVIHATGGEDTDDPEGQGEDND